MRLRGREEVEKEIEKSMTKRAWCIKCMYQCHWDVWGAMRRGNIDAAEGAYIF
jgi:hypothetical protein